MTSIIIGTRGSPLAIAQSTQICDQILHYHPDLNITLKTISTYGDELQSLPDAAQPTSFEKGWFTGALENALLEKQVDMVVHSLKDLPTASTHDTLIVAAIPKRVFAEDLLISKMPTTSFNPLLDLPEHSTIGTGSPRRRSQILAIRPDLCVRPIRGNVGTRIQKLIQDPSLDAIILARAGLARLSFSVPKEIFVAPIPLHVLLPAPGQGALAIQTRQDDKLIQDLLLPIHDPRTAQAVTAERAFLQALGGGCLAPVAAFAEYQTHAASIQAFFEPAGFAPRKYGLSAPPDTSPVTLAQRLAKLFEQSSASYVPRS
ncbi:MAG: hydroxymethylbilane synthase [Methylacidiphilales bacterium]|nr:hydroxymethylbilane synthase [Candidatus Methylacidiphilales bacterium]MDW8349921.1 hydroxymethylbilane synthase [Verrucomicrobiae bacterium]